MRQISVERAALLEASVIASFGVGQRGTFRPRDVRFFVDIFNNWMDPVPGSGSGTMIQNTQIGRYLNALALEKVIRLKESSKKKEYTLSLRGLPTLIHRMMERDYSDHPACAFFVYLFSKYYFIPFVEERLESEQRRFHRGLRHLLDLANPGIFIEAQLFYVDERLRGFQRAFSIQKETDSFIAEHGDSPSEEGWIDDAETSVSFFIHTEKPLKKLLRKGGLDRVQWEVDEGRHQRLKLLWKSEVARLEIFRTQLEEIR